MSSEKAIADVFITAFKTLSSGEQRAILSQMLKIRKLREDLVDIAIAESRIHEKPRPFSVFLAETKK